MADKQLHLVIVTPERTVVDEPAAGLRFPLFDGQIGILPGRTPLVGRLGYGELVVTTASGQQSYFVDGGFVQINGPVVTLLTARCLPSADIDLETARKTLEEAKARPAVTDFDVAARFRDVERARRMVALKK